jgi:hypothetical protein
MVVRIGMSSAAFLLAAGLFLLAPPRSAAAPQGQPSQSAAPSGQSGMADMMKMHETMMAETKAAEARLDALVKTMNAASGDAKVAAIAAVVNEMVAQQKTMHSHMHEMHQHMMGGPKMMGGRGMMMGQ